ncbi:50S ribosomal protein L18 [Hydrogenobaculum acidophilum]
MKLSREEKRIKRHRRIRKKISGVASRPRLCIYRSLNAFYASLVDDSMGKTILTVSSLSKEYVDATGKRGGKSIEAVQKVAEILVQKAKEKGIEKAVFDRSGYLYHGKVKAFAEKCRELGLIN